MKTYDIEANGITEYIYYFENGVYINSFIYKHNGEIVNDINPEHTFEEGRLSFNKKVDDLISTIDSKTEQTISQGFLFDSIRFSLSANAQINLSNIPNIPEQAFPFTYLGKDDELYELTFANKMNFYFTALNTVKNIRITNGSLKVQLKALTTTEELDTFKLINNL